MIVLQISTHKIVSYFDSIFFLPPRLSQLVLQLISIVTNMYAHHVVIETFLKFKSLWEKQIFERVDFKKRPSRRGGNISHKWK